MTMGLSRINRARAEPLILSGFERGGFGRGRWGIGLQATGHVNGTLLRESLKNRDHFLKHMFSGNGMIHFLGQALPGHGLAKFYSKTPATFINDATGGQFRL